MSNESQLQREYTSWTKMKCYKFVQACCKILLITEHWSSCHTSVSIRLTQCNCIVATAKKYWLQGLQHLSERRSGRNTIWKGLSRMTVYFIVSARTVLSARCSRLILTCNVDLFSSLYWTLKASQPNPKIVMTVFAGLLSSVPLEVPRPDWV